MMATMDEYPYFSTTIRYGIDDQALLLLMHQLSAGQKPTRLPRNLRAFKVQDILQKSELEIRRFAHQIIKLHSYGVHIVLLAQHPAELGQIRDTVLLQWMRAHCLTMQNDELL